MAPTVYIADLSPVSEHSDSDGEETRGDMSTLILGFGVDGMRMRRRNSTIQHGRVYNRRLMAEASRHPTSRDCKAWTPHNFNSIDNSLCSILNDNLELSDPQFQHFKSRTRSCPSRLVFLNKRRGLLDITLRTVALIRRNQQLQLRLTALQTETKAFVLNNPENQGLKLVPTPRSPSQRVDSDGEDSSDRRKMDPSDSAEK